MVEWEGSWHCLYLDDYRISGGKPWAGGTGVYQWDVKTQQLRDILVKAKEAGSDTLTFEIFQHANKECSVYLNQVLLEGRRHDSRSAQARRVGSTIRYLKPAKLEDFGRANGVLAV